MSNQMIERVAKAIREAKDACPYYVAPSPYRNKWNVFKALDVRQIDINILSLVSQDEAEEKCEQLNNEYIARKAVEVLITPTEEMWKASERYIDSPSSNAAFWSAMILSVLKKTDAA